MSFRIRNLVFIALIAFSICAPTVSARTPDTPKRNIFVFHTDEFWLNLHHFLYVLGRVENKETDTAREAVSGAPSDQQSGLKKLNAKEQEIWREAVASYAQGLVSGILYLIIRCLPSPLLWREPENQKRCPEPKSIQEHDGYAARRPNLSQGVVGKTSRSKPALAEGYERASKTSRC